MLSKALLILSLTCTAFAGVFITSPTASTTFVGGQPAQITWQESGIAPTLKTFGLAKFSIYAGNALQQTSLQLLNASVDVSSTTSITVTPSSTIGPNSGEYFIRVESLTGKDSNGTDFLAFSSKFTLSNMTGTFSSAVQSQIAGQTTAPLAGQTSTASPTSSVSATVTGTSKTATGTSSAIPSASKTASGAMGIKAAWTGIVFGGLVGITMS